VSRQSAIEKREKSLGEQVIIVVLLAAMMALFLYYFFKQSDELSQAGFGNLAHNFSAKITAIRAQWYMDKQPQLVFVRENTSQNASNQGYGVPVNTKGWVDVGDAKAGCEKIWQFVMGTELVFMKQPIAVISVEDAEHNKARRCRYSLPDGEFFEYHPNTGKVKYNLQN